MRIKPVSIPLWVYDLLAGALKPIIRSYPERYIKRFASVIGKLSNGGLKDTANYWEHFQDVRTPASICNTTALWLCQYLQRNYPDAIMEFGSGFSTFVIAVHAMLQFEKTGEKVLFISLEHDAVWYEIQLHSLRRLNMLRWVKLVYAPLIWKTQSGNEVAFYDLMQLDKSGIWQGLRYGMTLVDGPVGSIHGGPGREGSLMQALSMTKPGGLLCLHDALRHEEYELLHRLLREHQSRVRCVGIVPDSDGLALIEKLENPSIKR